MFHGKSGIDNLWQWIFDGPERFLGIVGWQPLHGDKILYDEDGRVGVHVGAVIPPWMTAKAVPTVEGRAYYLDDYTRSKFVIHHGAIEDGQFEDYRTAGYRFGVGLRSLLLEEPIL